MMRHVARLKMSGRRFGILLFAAAWTCYAARDAAASIVVSVSPATTTVAPGSTGDSFEVTLTNTGTASFALIEFRFDLMTSPSTSITFTSATTSTTDPYIFAGSSALGPNIGVEPEAGSIDVSDITTLASGTTVGAGDTVGLAHVVFNVSPTATAGDVAVHFEAFPFTGFDDPNGNNLAFDSLTGGTIAIQNSTSPGSVPEPSATLVWAGIGTLGLIGYARRRRRPVILPAGSATTPPGPTEKEIEHEEA